MNNKKLSQLKKRDRREDRAIPIVPSHEKETKGEPLRAVDIQGLLLKRY